MLTPGTGKDHPKDASDRVKVDYTGWTTDGKMFDSSVARGQPATFGVGEVIAGWTEALKLMVAGEKRRLWIPAKLAYGDHPQMGGAYRAGNLTFDVELHEILGAAEDARRRERPSQGRPPAPKRPRLGSRTACSRRAPAKCIRPPRAA